MNQPGSQFEGSLQHHDFFEGGGGHITYARCEPCMKLVKEMCRKVLH